MTLSEIKRQAVNVAEEFNFTIFEVDRTAHTLNLRLIIDYDLFVQIYANTKKDKLNLAVILSGNRIYGHDKEGGLYHLHPFTNPDEHFITNTKKSIREFVLEAMIYLDERELL